MNGGATNGCETWWDRHNLKVRTCIATILWVALLGTWICFVSRTSLRGSDKEFARLARERLAMIMAGLVHAATAGCLILMGVMAIDMRNDKLLMMSVSGYKDRQGVSNITV